VNQNVMACYRLAKFYGRHPNEFLSKPFSEVRRHMHWTNQLIEEMNRNDG